MTGLLEARQWIQPLLRTNAPADAVAAFYALAYDEKRTRLTLGRNDLGQVNGFVAVCQTGMDLFRPLVILRAESVQQASALLADALIAGRPYYVVAPPDLAPALTAVLDASECETHNIYQVSRASFKPVINVLVVGSRDSENKPRFVIRSAAGEAVAEAGINWQSDEFAEVYVQVQPAAQGRGLGRSVVSACTAYVLEAGLRPLYITNQNNRPAIRLCQALGYTHTGAQECICSGICRTQESAFGAAFAVVEPKAPCG